ncbi:MAG: MgtC/SapB family protein [Candidatus Gastranaerophilales bacterium]|nr:MgtC/SapB family protein [Candidatus Gastranaerophilales bacterium]
MELTLHELSYYIDIIIRVLVAMVLGFAIGFERELTSKFAGLRTHILVCVGSCIFTILSIFVFPTVMANGHYEAFGDPARIAAQVLTGIGFIGGGTVLRHGSSVFGLTTAATLWTTASIGMAVGCGQLILGGVAAILTLIVLVVVRKLETGFLHKFTQKTATIRATLIVDSKNINDVVKALTTKFDKILEINHDRSDRMDNKEKIYFETKVFSQNPVRDVFNQVSESENVDNIFITNMNFEK